MSKAEIEGILSQPWQHKYKGWDMVRRLSNVKAQRTTLLNMYRRSRQSASGAHSTAKYRATAAKFKAGRTIILSLKES